MATKKDLVEAYSFSRRRLVTAFVSGAPGGREVEPTKPGRTIIGGAALAVLLVAGAAIAGIFSPRDPEDWNKPGLILSKETGAAYVITDTSSTPELRPVINITSARLILEGGVEPTLVSQATIDKQIVGDDIGILGAPASVPTSSLLIQTGWTACTADSTGIQLTVAEEPDVDLAPHEGFVVESKGVDYLIAEARPVNGVSPGAYSFELPTLPAGSRDDDDLDNMLGDLNVDPRPSAVRVGEDWLDLFPPGAMLDFQQFGLTDFGSPVPYADSDGVPQGARVGDVVTFPGGETGTRSMLLTAKGPALLDDFALAVYRHTRTPDGRLSQGPRSGGSPVETTQDAAPTPRQDTRSFDSAHWPNQVLEQATGDPCAVLRTTPGGSPSVVLGTNPGDAAKASGIDSTNHEPSVSPGRGAYVLSGDWADKTRGSAFLIDAKGRRYSLVGPEVPDRLGYGDVPVVVVPDSWVELFRPGVNLSVDAALCTPDLDEGQKCE
jgi:type VII secretion protein EccB